MDQEGLPKWRAGPWRRSESKTVRGSKTSDQEMQSFVKRPGGIAQRQAVEMLAPTEDKARGFRVSGLRVHRIGIL